MSTAVPLTEAEQQAVVAVGKLFENALGPLDGNDPPEGGAHPGGGYFMEPDKFGRTNEHFPSSLLGALVALLKDAKLSVDEENPANKLESWRKAVHPRQCSPTLRRAPTPARPTLRQGSIAACSTRLVTEESRLVGACARHGHHDWLTAACYGMNCVTKAPCLQCGEGGDDTMHCIACSRPRFTQIV